MGSADIIKENGKESGDNCGGQFILFHFRYLGEKRARK